MPINQREAVRLLAIQIGVREAARQLGLNEDRVCKWSERGKWFAKPSHPKARNAHVSTVSSPGDILLQAIADDNVPTRAALAKAHRKAAEHAQAMSGVELLKPGTAQALRQHGQGAASVHGWNDQQQGKGFSLNVLNLGRLSIGVNPEPEADKDAPGTDTLDA